MEIALVSAAALVVGQVMGFTGAIWLQRAAHRQRLQEARAAKWYEAAASVVGELYKRLAKVDAAFDRIKRPHVGGNDEELKALGQEAHDRGRELEEFFWDNRIRLGKAECEAIEAFLLELRDVLNRYHAFVEAPYTNTADELRDLNALTARVVTKVRPFCQFLEDRFRALLA